MADALTLGATYSSVQGLARPLPWEHAPSLLTTGRALLSYSCSAALRFALRRMGERQTYAPPSPFLRISKHRSPVEESSIWSRKKPPILGTCSGPPRYY